VTPRPAGQLPHLVDCDTHCVPPSGTALGPYLPEVWAAYLRENGFKQPIGIGITYPPWSDMLAVDSVEPARFAADVLRDAGLAVVHCYYGVESLSHLQLAAALATAVNRWLEAEWLEQDDRLVATGVITPHDTIAAVREITRLADNPRFAGVLLPARSVEPYGGRRFWPIWEAMAEHGLPLAITYGGSVGTPPSPVGWFDSLFEDYAAAGPTFQAHVTSLVLSGVFERFPGLKVVVMESGWTWLPSLLWRMDREWKGLRREVPWMKDLPSEYVKRHIRMTTHPIDDPGRPEYLQQVIEQLGCDEILMYGSDYPHRYGPSQPDLLAVLTAPVAERVAWRNAWETFRLA
jgi:predicted TIM-barrel fold metal-dependent hydrolase